MSTLNGTAPETKRLASKIVTPTADEEIMRSYVKTRSKGVTKSLCFSHDDDQDLDGEEQMIGALNDMDNMDNQGDGMMELEQNEDMLNEDDLLREELREAEEFTNGSQPEHNVNREVQAGSTSGRGVLQVNDQSPAPGKLEGRGSALGKGH
ncbi:unnamed protein product [Eruca vesicaria subsp. sativa]|uniref:Uncharacterized protein n=1 Tax=Eruca vesicaria subsp. sativa TaxID=29727 RepID=A0ABC8JG51_ERUVS|nr:unnamed protein product [Eruca vesicaria subsp. sativa]